MIIKALVTLDLLNEGRVIASAGLGGVGEEFSVFGKPAAAKARAAMLDEGLTVLDRLLSGEKVWHYGEHYVVEGVRLPRFRPIAQESSSGSAERATQRCRLALRLDVCRKPPSTEFYGHSVMLDKSSAVFSLL